MKRLLLFLLGFLLGCDTPTVFTHEFGYYGGTRDSGRVVVLNHFSSCGSAFDSTTCVSVQFCVTTVPFDTQNDDPLVVPKERCHRFLEEALAAERPS